MRSHSEALGFRISTFKFGGHNSACDSVVDALPPKKRSDLKFDVVEGREKRGQAHECSKNNNNNKKKTTL